MVRKWNGLPKRFSEAGVASVSIVGLTSAGTSSIVPVLIFAPDFLQGGWTWVWLISSFLISLGFGVLVARPLIQLYRSLHGELVLRKDQLNVRLGLNQKSFTLDLNKPVDVEACWYTDTNQFHGNLHARLRQNGDSLTLYSNSGTAQAGARLGIPKRRPPISTWRRRVRLHPLHLSEILEVLKTGPDALRSPLDAPNHASTILSA